MKQKSTRDPNWMLREVRIRASLLMKAARAGDADALERLGAVPKHRTALNAIAMQMAGQSYLELRAKTVTEKFEGHQAIADPSRLFEKHVAQFMNHWFASYEEALAHLKKEGGFLFPFRSQFVIVGHDLLRLVGLDPDDPDWASISWDWVNPTSTAGFENLNAMLVKAGFEKTGGSHD